MNLSVFHAKQSFFCTFLFAMWLRLTHAHRESPIPKPPEWPPLHVAKTLQVRIILKSHNFKKKTFPSKGCNCWCESIARSIFRNVVLRCPILLPRWRTRKNLVKYVNWFGEHVQWFSIFFDINEGALFRTCTHLPLDCIVTSGGGATMVTHSLWPWNLSRALYIRCWSNHAIATAMLRLWRRAVWLVLRVTALWIRWWQRVIVHNTARLKLSARFSRFG